MKKVLVVLAVVSMSVVIAGGASASGGTSGAPRMGSMSGSQETGPADPDGTGFVRVTLNAGQDRVCWTITWASIDAPFAWHIHRAPAGVAGPIVLPFTVGGTYVQSGCRTGLDDPALLQDITDFPDQYYANVHNAAYPGGAIRGQLSVPGQTLRVSQTPHLRIGTVLSVTGALSIFGASQQNAVDMAVAEINAAGGVLGQPVLVFHEDDGTNPTLAAQAATSLVTQDNVSVIIGATGSGASLAVLSIAASSHVLELSPSSTNPIFSNLSLTQGWFARTVTSDALQGLVAASYVEQNLSLLHAGAIGIDNAYGRGVTSAFVENYSRFGGAITPGSPRIVSEFQTDYTADLVSVLNVNPTPQAVYVATFPTNGVVLMRNWWAGVTSFPAWKNVKWLFSEGVYDQSSFIDSLVSLGVDVSGFLGTAPALYAGFVPPSYAEWAARYTTRYGSPPQLFAANAYDATYLAALAAQAAGSLAPAAMRSKLAAVADPPGVLLGPRDWTVALAELAAGHDINYDGASGPVNLNVYGDIPGPYVIWGVDTGNRLYVKESYSEGVVVGLSAGLYQAPAANSDVALTAIPVSPRDRLKFEEELRIFS